MKTYISSFPNQLKEGLAIAKNAILRKHENIQHVLISGLGGSGIGGTLVSEIVAQECAVPILVNKDYDIPSYVNKHTLVIISSYSGNTEETISVLKKALEANAQIVCISSGGIISDIAKKEKLDLITIPGGNPPRTCLGYSLIQLFQVLSANGLIGNSFHQDIIKTIELLEHQQSNITSEATVIAKKLVNKIPVIYALGKEGVAVRFRQQINENSKMLCWHHVIPEMNHNELVGWTTKNEDLAVVVLRTSSDLSKNIQRLEICKNIFAQCTSTFIEIHAKGVSNIEQTLYLVHLTDWVSSIIADLRGIDPIEVNVINLLKDKLAASAS